MSPRRMTRSAGEHLHQRLEHCRRAEGIFLAQEAGSVWTLTGSLQTSSVARTFWAGSPDALSRRSIRLPRRLGVRRIDPGHIGLQLVGARPPRCLELEEMMQIRLESPRAGFGLSSDLGTGPMDRELPDPSGVGTRGGLGARSRLRAAGRRHGGGRSWGASLTEPAASEGRRGAQQRVDQATAPEALDLELAADRRRRPRAAGRVSAPGTVSPRN